MFDLVIKNGILVDGSASKQKEADLIVHKGRIFAIEDSGKNVEAKNTIDAKGKIVCPGFIDILDQSDIFWTLFTSPRLESKVLQGVTTIIGGSCGSSLAPVLGHDSVDSIKKWISVDNIGINWTRFSEFFDEITKRKIGLNFGTLVGHETLRRSIMADGTRRISEQEVKMMGKMLYDGLQEGALGMSTGLVFSHAKMTTNEEIEYLSEIIKSAEGYYASHIRGEDEELLPSINEAIQIGRKTGVSVEISHFKAIGRKYWNDMKLATMMIENANEEGVNIDFDMYPYDTTGSVLYIMLPDWVSEGGNKKMLSRLRDPDLRQRIILETKAKGYDYENLVVSMCPRMKEVVGRTIIEISKNQEITPEECMIELLISSSGRVIVFNKGILSEENLAKQIKNFHCMISSTGAGYDLEKIEGGELVHPRCFGTFPRVIRKYVRENHVISLEEAINKMTLKPAEKIGIKDRGVIRQDYCADIVIFDYEKMTDKADFINPYQYAEGVEYVIINGEVVVDNGIHTGKLVGKIIKK